MRTSTVGAKGRVTIPADLRATYGIKPGDRVSFVESGGRIVLQPDARGVAALLGLLKVARGASSVRMDSAIDAGRRRRASR